MSQVLDVYAGGAQIGHLKRSPTGRLSFEYQRRWQFFPRSFALSFSLPLAQQIHEGKVVENFLWNLLPDNEETLKAWGREFGVSHRNVFALLEVVGADVAGAIQIVPPGTDLSPDISNVTWISDDDVESRLRRLRVERTWTGRRSNDAGHFSLPGAQPKMALLRGLDGRWGVPGGRMATTHIFKPPLQGLTATTEIEHACLALASRMGMLSARSEVGQFGSEIAIVVERYDRVRQRDGTIGRIHQEDMAQALGVHPDSKYEKDGGPSAEAVLGILSSTSAPSEDIMSFLRALAFNFVIAGTDAHAKNFSILHLSGRRSRMAPLYDVISYLPFVSDVREIERQKMAQKIGGKYLFGDVMPRHWEKLASSAGLSLDEVVGLVSDYAVRMPGEMEEVRDVCRSQGLQHEALDTLALRISERCERLVMRYGTDMPSAYSPR